MAPATKSAPRPRLNYPIRNLKAAAAALSDAMEQVGAKPRKQAVHQLRVCARKFEAELEVLAAAARHEPQFRIVEEQVHRVQKLLHRVARVAGRVRDLDVQRQLAKECVADGATKRLLKETKHLRGELKNEREAEAAKLVMMLVRRGRKLERRLGELLDALQPMDDLALSKVDLEVLAQEWYGNRIRSADLQPKREDRMHGIRKAAKLARYMTEGRLAARLTDRFEAVQAAGGRWHDSLTLLDAARDRLGKRSSLATLLGGHEEAARSAFEAMLETPA